MPSDNQAAFGVYPHMLKRPEAHNDREASANFPAEVAKALAPQDLVDVGLMAVPYGGALRKLGVGLAAAGLSTDAEAGALSRLLKSAKKWAPAKLEQLAEPSEHKMLQALYRGYAGDYDAAKAAQEAGLVYATPQRAAAEAYARNRVKQAARRGETAEPHVEMVLIDPDTGRRYGHSTLGTGAQAPIRTLAAELQPEDVVSTTNLYAEGGAVEVAALSDEQRKELERLKELMRKPAEYWERKKRADENLNPTRKSEARDLDSLYAAYVPDERFAEGGEVNAYGKGGLVEPPLPAAEFSPLDVDYIIGNVMSAQHEPAYAEGGSVETAHIPYDEAKISSLVNALREELHA